MKTSTIQTLHPQPTKANKRISLEKYNFIRDHVLAILNEQELTHKELMQELFKRVKKKFDGGVKWYGEIIKLDLEARHLIERTEYKREKYKIITKK